MKESALSREVVFPEALVPPSFPTMVLLNNRLPWCRMYVRSSVEVFAGSFHFCGQP